MNRRQRKRKLKAKRDWQAYVKARRTVGHSTFRIYDGNGVFSQPIYAGSFLPENTLESMSAITVEIQVNSHGFRESLQAAAEAMASEAIDQGALVEWTNEVRSTVRGIEPQPSTAATLEEALARAVGLISNNPQTRLVYNGEEPYSNDMPGMTLDKFQAWSDQLIREVQGECDVMD